MRIYVDTSALLKRGITEAESGPLERALQRHTDERDALVASALASVEVNRAMRARLNHFPHDEITAAVDDSLAGINEWAVSREVIGLARQITPQILRSLDAIHLATAMLLVCDFMITYDVRLAEAAKANGIKVTAPA